MPEKHDLTNNKNQISFIYRKKDSKNRVKSFSLSSSEASKKYGAIRLRAKHGEKYEGWRDANSKTITWGLRMVNLRQENPMLEQI